MRRTPVLALAGSLLPLSLQAAPGSAGLPPDSYPVFGMLLVGGAVLFVWGFLTFKRKRLIENLPTSKIRSMAIGLVELKGRAVGWNPLKAPFTGEACVYYRYRVEEYKRGNKNSKWVTVRQGASDGCPFYIEDETGRALVHPQGVKAEVAEDYRVKTGTFSEIPPRADEFLQSVGFSCRNFFGFDKTLRFTEYRIEPGQEVYVLGTCQTNDRVVAHAYLRALQAVRSGGSPVRELGGGVTVGSKELAHALPEGQEPVAPPGEDPAIVGRSKGMPFVLSDQSEKHMTRGMGWKSFLGVFGGIALLAFAAHLMMR